LPELVDAIDNAVKKLEDLGAIIEEVQLPSFDLFSASGYMVMRAEAFALHQENLRNRPRDYGRFAYQRIMSGLGVLGSDYVQAMRVRRELVRTVNLQVLDKYQAIVTASAFGPAPRLDSFGPDVSTLGGTPSIMFNVTGNPTLCIPIGFASNGLPLGMQIAGRPFDEGTLFRIGVKFEAETRDVSRRPMLARSPP
jgi:aspartyl-tRNA(Asn)/glutamyl-tRNA(Gln) amidotransferase subunit A